MRFAVGLKNSSRYFSGTLAVGVAVLGVAAYAPPVVAQPGTEVKAVICKPSATVSLTSPLSDSLSERAGVLVRGKVSQATQVEIYIDDQFDRVVPLSQDETAFETELTMSPGTHTIRAVAIDFCQLQNGESEVVVTYTPPGGGSVGADVPTNVADGAGETPPGPQGVTGYAALLPVFLREPVESTLRWLNISTVDSSGGPAKLSLVRAIIIGAAAYVALFGLAAGMIEKLRLALLHLPRVKELAAADVQRWARRIGLAVLLLALFF